MKSTLFLPFALLLLGMCAASNTDIETQMQKVLRLSRERRNGDITNLLFLLFGEMLFSSDGGGACIGRNDCCQSVSPCGIGEGDCDRDEDCIEGLECGRESDGNSCRLFMNHLTDIHTYSRYFSKVSCSETFERMLQIFPIKESIQIITAQ